MESDIRYYRRRHNEELAAAGRAVTVAARDRRMQLADLFLQRLKGLEGGSSPCELGLASIPRRSSGSAFDWERQNVATR